MFAASLPHVANHPAVSMCHGDVRTFDAPEGHFTHAIHGATDVASPACILDTFDVTVSGTRRVLDFCRDHGVRDLLLISSGAIYGRQPPNLNWVEEDYSGAPATTDPRSAYGQGKRAAEWLVAAYSADRGPAAHIARCFALVGPHLPIDKHFAMGNFIRDALQRQTIRIGGDGTPIRSYLYAADLAAWLWTILANGAVGQAYNVGSDVVISVGALARIVKDVVGVEKEIVVAKKPLAGMSPERYVPNIAKARHDLGLEVWTPLPQAVAKTVMWHQPGATSR